MHLIQKSLIQIHTAWKEKREMPRQNFGISFALIMAEMNEFWWRHPGKAELVLN